MSPPVESGAALAVHQLVQHLRTQDIGIPPYPAVALALEKLNGPRTMIAEIVKLIASDAALAASTLRLAAVASMTSAAPPTLQAAIQKIGFHHLYRHVLALSLGARATSPGPLAALRRDEWRRALVGSVLAAELAPRRALSGDLASLAALLHDFGAIVVVAALEQIVTGLPSLPLASWRAAVQELHVEIGEVVALRWHLAEPISAVIAYHHAPERAPALHRPLVALIATLDHVLDVLDRHPVEGVAALAGVDGLLAGEAARIGAVIPRISRVLAAFENPSPRGAQAAPSKRSLILEDGWPASFEVIARGGQVLRAVALAPTAFAFHSPSAMPTSWLTELTLRSPPDSVQLLVNVTSCDALGGRLFLIVARPFGLDGLGKAAWLRLLARIRPPSTQSP